VDQKTTNGPLVSRLGRLDFELWQRRAPVGAWDEVDSVFDGSYSDSGSRGAVLNTSKCAAENVGGFHESESGVCRRTHLADRERKSGSNALKWTRRNITLGGNGDV
jgi:hypothetical protein